MTDVQQGGAPAAGWYPDPATPGASRWWSGQSWTDHVQPAVVAPPAYAEPVYAGPVALAPAVAAPADLVPAARIEPRSQEDWHAQPSLGTDVHRQAPGSVSLSTGVATGSRRHDPYRQRNWIAGVALALALLSIPGLGWRSVADLPALTQSVFAGAPIGVALLGLVLSFRRGSGLILSIAAIVIAGAVLAAGFLVEPAVLREITLSVLAMLPV